ncbi:MAG: FG-GAP-like repeat-containing protein [Desulfatiglandaceae bacterium]
MKIKTSILLPLLLTLLMTAMGSSPAKSAIETPKKVGILPFTMNADRGLAYLQNGIMDMLASRLAWKGKVKIIEKDRTAQALGAHSGSLNKAEALEIGKELEADYVILGSLTVFGDSVSIDAKILDVDKSEERVTAYDQSKGMDGVIPTVNQFAEDINAKLMGRRAAPASEETARPERQESALIEVGSGASDGLKRPSFVQRLKLEIRGLDTGDLDGDGKTELALIDKDTVYIYKWRKSRLYQFKAIKGSWSPDYIYISIADLDQNGRAEMYVSSLSATGVMSLIYEWDGKDFKQVMGRQPWLMRVVDLPGRGPSLVGQKRGTEGSYRGDVHILMRKGDDLISAGPLKLPRHGNVFNFVQTDLTGKGARYTTMLGPYEHLLLYDEAGERLYKSDEYFGGSLTFISEMDPDQNRMVNTAKRVFISSPIFLFDIDSEGKKEVVICQNHSPTGRITEDFRWFNSGRVHFMGWDGVAMVSTFTSQKLSGTITGYQIADLDDDGQMELIIASVTSESYFVGMPKSRLVMYDLE